jgi:iron complex transport system substrate-binding protein
VIQRRPLIVAGPNTFFTEILTTSGAINAVPTGSVAYPRVTMEEILKWQPEVILDIDPSSGIENWQAFQTLPAVANRQIHFLAPELFFPGPRIAKGAEVIANILYPKEEK